MSTINDNDILLVYRGGDFKIQASDLKDRLANGSLQSNDLMLANRNGSDSQLKASDFVDKAQDDDWYLINRHNTDYKVKGKDLKEYLTPQQEPWDIRPRMHIVNFQNGARGSWKVYGTSTDGRGYVFYKYPQWELAYPDLKSYESTKFDPADFDPGQEFMVVAGFETKGDSFSALCSGWGGTWDWGPDTDTTGLTSLRRFMKDVWEMSDMEWHGLWDTSQVTDFSEMFARSQTWNGDVNHLDTSGAERLSGMFTDCPQFNKPLNTWDVSNAYIMEDMFYMAKKFDQDISMWNTKSLRDPDHANAKEGGASKMFYRSGFTGDISNWCVSKLTVEPQDFGVPAPRAPIWGTCPRGEDKA